MKLGTSEIKVLNRLAISPNISKAGLARDLSITRSAVTQMWQRLEKNHSLQIRSNLDYESLGLRLLFGWFEGAENDAALEKTKNWLESNPYISCFLQSSISSSMNQIVYFESIVPPGGKLIHILEQINRFGKRPYNLEVFVDFSNDISENFNLGLFDGNKWDFKSDFRFGASIYAVKNYAEVLPKIEHSDDPPQDLSNDLTQVIALALRENYHVSATEIYDELKQIGFKPPSKRTIRRRLAELRKWVTNPYLHVEGIGLEERVIVCIEDASDSNISRILRAQSSILPRARILVGNNLTVMFIDIPNASDWLTLTEIFNQIMESETRMCTFIAKKYQEVNLLERLVPHLLAPAHTRSWSK